MGIPDTNDQILHYKSQKENGEMWEAKAKELMSVEAIHFQQLGALWSASSLPVSRENPRQVDQILNKQREAHRQIVAYTRLASPHTFKTDRSTGCAGSAGWTYRNYTAKPLGRLTLKRSKKRHEDWMRRGKSYWKSECPLHILQQHMSYVESRNSIVLRSKTDLAHQLNLQSRT